MTERRPSRLVQMEDVISSSIIHADKEVIGTVLLTHLALEALLIEIIEKNESDIVPYRWNFPKKTKYLLEAGLIQEHQLLAFNRYNDFRNDFAHTFAHTINLKDALALARELEGHGIDFSDSVRHYPEADAEKFYGGLLGVLAEISWCILYDAAFSFLEAGGRDVFSA